MLQIDEAYIVYYCKSNQFLLSFFQIPSVCFVLILFLFFCFFFGFFYFNFVAVRSIEMHQYLIVRVILLDSSKITLTI